MQCLMAVMIIFGEEWSPIFIIFFFFFFLGWSIVDIYGVVSELLGQLGVGSFEHSARSF